MKKFARGERTDTGYGCTRHLEVLEQVLDSDGLLVVADVEAVLRQHFLLHLHPALRASQEYQVLT
jgi:hypothetical protein